MKNSKNDFPLVWSKTKAPTASLPVVMTLRWQTAGRWGSWRWSHTCTTSLGNSWVWRWRLAVLSVWCKTSSQAGGPHVCMEDSKCFFKRQRGLWVGSSPWFLCVFFPGRGRLKKPQLSPTNLQGWAPSVSVQSSEGPWPRQSQFCTARWQKGSHLNGPFTAKPQFIPLDLLRGIPG